MQCHDFEQHVADYVLRELPERDRQDADEHLAGCDVCRQLLAETEAAAATLPRALTDCEPPESVEQRVLEAISAPATVPLSQQVAPAGQRPRRRSWLAAASLLAVAAGLGGWLGVTTTTRQTETTTVDADRRAAQEALAGRIDSVRRSDEQVAGHALQYAAFEGTGDTGDQMEGYVAADPLARQWHIIVRGLAELPIGRAYYVWIGADLGDGTFRWQKGRQLQVDERGVASLVLDMPEPSVGIGRLIVTEEAIGAQSPSGKPRLAATL